MPAKLGNEQRDWIKKAEKKGWTVKLSTNQHVLFIPPEGAEDRTPVPVPGRKFKDNRGLKNAKSQLRRKGLDID